MKATYKPITIQLNWRTVKLDPGQFVTGRLQASKETGLSAQCVRTCLQALKSTSNITIKTTNRFSIITIINWNSYQSEEIEINQQNNQHFNQPVTSSQPAANHIQEHKNKRKEIIYPDDFETFWKEYPKHVKKIVAFAEWKKIDTSNGTLQKIMNGIKDWKNSQQWNDNDGKYIPDPERFLKNRRWEDEIKKINIQQQSLMPRN